MSLGESESVARYNVPKLKTGNTLGSTLEENTLKLPDLKKTKSANVHSAGKFYIKSF